jgi:hypothetical protein
MGRRRPMKLTRPHLWRWLVRGVGAMAVLFVIGFGALLVLVHNLDKPWIKKRVRQLLLTSVGL